MYAGEVHAAKYPVFTAYRFISVYSISQSEALASTDKKIRGHAVPSSRAMTRCPSLILGGT
jgi:hypothetical protein